MGGLLVSGLILAHTLTDFQRGASPRPFRLTAPSSALYQVKGRRGASGGVDRGERTLRAQRLWRTAAHPGNDELFIETLSAAVKRGASGA